MTRVMYVNGRYAPYADAAIHAEDRGFQFADGVYEVCEVRDGCLVDERRHMRRLGARFANCAWRSPWSLRALGVILRETVRRNRVRNGIVYLQITRGVAQRDFAFPPAVAPTVVCFARSLSRSKARSGRRPAFPSSRCPISAGPASTSRPQGFSRNRWPASRQRTRAPTRPGWWTGKASSPRAHPATPGS